MEPTDTELIQAVLKGESARFEPLVVKYSPRLFAMARRYARRDSEVEDIVQEVWTKAYVNLRGFRGEAPFGHAFTCAVSKRCLEPYGFAQEVPGGDVRNSQRP